MHGRVPREGERSCRSPQSNISWHMHPTVLAVDSNSFLKDGRKISVGDCALFKPPQDSPPFIGLIRWLTLGKDNNLKLGVNWLYRPAELKLGKGSLLDGAPNEIFYSFHKDEIPAASLLHPCKVAFLPRGAEPPTGTSSFVCRHVYDIESECLWWLTDQDYIDERQEEVDQLLYKTKTEMHGTLQSGGRSPKQANGLTSASQLKSGSEIFHNSGTSYPSQVKGKKRERGDHSADPVKRERSSRTDDGDTRFKAESTVKFDIARITEKGGLVDIEGVEKLVQLMQPDRLEKKIDLISRSMLTGVVAATEKVECLNRFVQLRGLPVLDEWLQDIHKGKVAGGNSSKDGDKSVEEFLLILLRALDKLPVNLHALQTCNIGRSVNHLRSHKNVEIQRKARSLVDTWKKRVEAEMISNDAKSGSIQNAPVWSSKSRLPEASHGGSRTPCGSDVAIKSSITQHCASKSTSVKSSHGESNTKSASSSPGPSKSVSPPASAKDGQAGISVGGTPDVPLIREDRSSSSNQSHSYSQSISGKDDGKSPASVSATASKMSGSSSRNRKISGFPGVTVAQKENSSNKSFSTSKSSTDKLSHSAVMSERVLEGSNTEASNHKLIVKIPNRVRSPARGFCGVSVEDTSVMSSQESPPVPAEKDNHIDSISKEKSDAHQCNVTSDMNVDYCQINGKNDILSGSVDGAGSPAVFPDEEKTMSAEYSRRFMECSQKDQLKCEKLHLSSFSPMNALIESCVKYSQARSSLSLHDDVGMNLLASVATGEMSRSELVSPTDSTERSIPTVDDGCFVGDEAKSRSSHEDHIHGSENELSNDAEGNEKKQGLLNSSWSEDGLNLSKQVPLSADINSGQSHTSADIPLGDSNKPYDSASRRNADPIVDKSNQTAVSNEKIRDGEIIKENQEEKVPSNGAIDNIMNCSGDETNGITPDKAGKDLSNTSKGKLMDEVVSSNQSDNIDCQSDMKESLDMLNSFVQKFTVAVVKSESTERANKENLQQTASGPKSISEPGNEVKVREGDESNTKSLCKVEGESLVGVVDRKTTLEGHIIVGSCSLADGRKSHNMYSEVETKETIERISLSEKGIPASLAHEGHKNDEQRGRKSSGAIVDGAKSVSTVVQVSSSAAAAAASDSDTKVKFDLNEGFTVDDGKYGEPFSLMASGPTTLQMTNILQFSLNSLSNPHPASITVAAAAKGPFLPSEDLLRTKGELRWKGSAATSAFRPAEPRKVIEMPPPLTKLLDDASTCKNGCAMLDIDLNIDLNVPDERVLDEMASRDCALSGGMMIDLVKNHAILPNECSMPVHGSGGLDFDLNRVDEPNENGQCSTSHNRKGESSMLHVNPFGGLPSTDVQRGFDLNDRPGIDDASVEHLAISQQIKVGIPSHLPSAGPRTNNPAMGSFSSWFTPGNTYSTVAIPSVIPDRADHPFQIIPPGAPQRTFPAGITPFTPDVYRGSVLSSSPAVSFPSSPFQFPVFPFGPSFPLPSASFPIGGTSYADSSSGVRLFAPPVNSQLLGPIGTISSQFQRPYVVGLPDSSSNSGLENSRNWGRHGLDLNAGPGATESEVREDILPLSSGQHSFASSQVQSEEQARMYSVSGSLKRTEPEAGWDKESFRYKQSSWQ